MIGFFVFMFIFALWICLLFIQICGVINNLQNKKRSDNYVWSGRTNANTTYWFNAVYIWIIVGFWIYRKFVIQEMIEIIDTDFWGDEISEEDLEKWYMYQI